MTQARQHNKESVEKDVVNSESFILEECHHCGKELEHIEDILVDNDDNYCCHECNTYYRLNARPCREIY